MEYKSLEYNRLIARESEFLQNRKDLPNERQTQELNAITGQMEVIINQNTQLKASYQEVLQKYARLKGELKGYVTDKHVKNT